MKTSFGDRHWLLCLAESGRLDCQSLWRRPHVDHLVVLERRCMLAKTEAHFERVLSKSKTMCNG